MTTPSCGPGDVSAGQIWGEVSNRQCFKMFFQECLERRQQDSALDMKQGAEGEGNVRGNGGSHL